jgi:hypothetical protein
VDVYFRVRSVDPTAAGVPPISPDYLFINLINLFCDTKSAFLEKNLPSQIQSTFALLTSHIEFPFVARFFNSHTYMVENLGNCYMYNSYGDANFARMVFFFTAEGFSDQIRL